MSKIRLNDTYPVLGIGGVEVEVFYDVDLETEVGFDLINADGTYGDAVLLSLDSAKQLHEFLGRVLDKELK